MPLKLIMFTIHNYMTMRDYSYSIDDICDLAIAICIGIWTYTYMTWTKEEIPLDVQFAVRTNSERYTFIGTTK